MKKLPKDVDGRNGDRAKWAQEAFWGYLNGTPPFCVDRGIKAWQEITKSEDEYVPTDLLCDIMHWCDRNPVDFETQVRLEKSKAEPKDGIVDFLRALRAWCRTKKLSYNKGLKSAREHYKAETGKAPY